MNFLILGDKYHKGMKSKGCAGLIKLKKNYTIFQHQYDTIKRYYPNAEVVYVGGFESKKIETFIKKNYKDVSYINNTDYESTSDGHSIYLTKNYLTTDTLIVFGYTIFDQKLFNRFDTSLGTQIVITPNNKKHIGCIINRNQIDNISFDLPNYIDDIYYLSTADAKILQNIISDSQYRNYFLFELINKLIDAGCIVKPIFCKTPNQKEYYAYIH